MNTYARKCRGCRCPAPIGDTTTRCGCCGARTHLLRCAVCRLVGTTADMLLTTGGPLHDACRGQPAQVAA